MAPQINVSISGTAERGGGKKYTVYQVSVDVASKWQNQLEKRYSEFRKLHSQLAKYYKTPEFPPKKAFGNRNPEFIQKRKEDLQQYLQNLAADERTANATEFIEFLEIPKTELENRKSLRALSPSATENAGNEGTSSTTSPRSDGDDHNNNNDNNDNNDNNNDSKSSDPTGSEPSSSSQQQLQDSSNQPNSSSQEDMEGVARQESASADERKKQCLRAFQNGSERLQSGDYEGAEQLLRESLDLIDEGAISEENRVMALASCLNYLALACKELKRFEEAEKMCRRAVDLGEELPQALHVKCLNTMAITYSSQKKTVEAQQLYLEILELMNKIPSAKESPVYAIAEGNLAQNFAEQQNYEKAIHHQKHSYELLLSAKGPEHPKTIESLHQLAVLYGESNDFEEARVLYQKLLDILQSGNEEYRQVVKMMQAFRYVVVNTDKNLVKKADKVISNYFG